MRHWAPPLERSRLATLAFSGCYAGVMFSLPISGEMTENLGKFYQHLLFFNCTKMSILRNIVAVLLLRHSRHNMVLVLDLVSFRETLLPHVYRSERAFVHRERIGKWSSASIRGANSFKHTVEVVFHIHALLCDFRSQFLPFLELLRPCTLPGSCTYLLLPQYLVTKHVNIICFSTSKMRIIQGFKRTRSWAHSLIY